MKKSIIVILINIFLFSTNYIQSQERYYYAFDEKIFLYEEVKNIEFINYITIWYKSVYNHVIF